MNLLDRLDVLLGGNSGGETNVALYCPLREEKDAGTRIATEETEPDAWIDEGRVALYECPVCGNRHRFLWGTPAPLYLGDEQGEQEVPA